MLDQLNRLIGPWVDGSRRVGTSPLRSVTRLEAVTSHGSSLFINRLQGEQGKQGKQKKNKNKKKAEKADKPEKVENDKNVVQKPEKPN